MASNLSDGDNDLFNPKWRCMCDASGSIDFGLRELMLRLEDIVLADIALKGRVRIDPRVHLAAALLNYLRLTDAEQDRATTYWFNWYSDRLDAPRRLRAVEKASRAALRSIFPQLSAPW